MALTQRIFYLFLGEEKKYSFFLKMELLESISAESTGRR